MMQPAKSFSTWIGSLLERCNRNGLSQIASIPGCSTASASPTRSFRSIRQQKPQDCLEPEALFSNERSIVALGALIGVDTGKSDGGDPS
jgi:hypothetical protein